MAHKIVNLDDEGNSVSITVAGKTFDIKRIVLKARQIYGEYLICAGEYLKKIAEAKNIDDKSVEELAAINESMKKAIEDYAIQKADYLEKLMTVILEKNGYTFDADWWEDNSDYNAMEQFIFAALKKDETETAAKKKAEVIS